MRYIKNYKKKIKRKIKYYYCLKENVYVKLLEKCITNTSKICISCLLLICLVYINYIVEL